MSYEGYVEKLCKNGHVDSFDAYDEPDDKCSTCDAPWAWTHRVDLTNGSDPNDPSTIMAPLEVDQESVWEECHCCGNKKLISERTYKIPTNIGEMLF